MKAGRVVEVLDGAFRAHVQYRDETGEKQFVRGPRRGASLDAQKDLDAMRAAAAAFPDDRAQAYSAMRLESTRLKEGALRSKEEDMPLSEAGQVAEVDGAFRADVQYT